MGLGVYANKKALRYRGIEDFPHAEDACLCTERRPEFDVDVPINGS